MTTRPTTGTLRAPGATLHYELRGRGPLLLLIPGGTGGAAALDAVADLLAADYRVATYAPPAPPNSPPPGPPPPGRPPPAPSRPSPAFPTSSAASSRPS